MQGFQHRQPLGDANEATARDRHTDPMAATEPATAPAARADTALPCVARGVGAGRLEESAVSYPTERAHHVTPELHSWTFSQRKRTYIHKNKQNKTLCKHVRAAPWVTAPRWEQPRALRGERLTTGRRVAVVSWGDPARLCKTVLSVRELGEGLSLND